MLQEKAFINKPTYLFDKYAIKWMRSLYVEFFKVGHGMQKIRVMSIKKYIYTTLLNKTKSIWILCINWWILISLCKATKTPLLMHRNNCILAWSHQYRSLFQTDMVCRSVMLISQYLNWLSQNFCQNVMSLLFIQVHLHDLPVFMHINSHGPWGMWLTEVWQRKTTGFENSWTSFTYMAILTKSRSFSQKLMFPFKPMEDNSSRLDSTNNESSPSNKASQQPQH